MKVRIKTDDDTITYDLTERNVGLFLVTDNGVELPLVWVDDNYADDLVGATVYVHITPFGEIVDDPSKVHHMDRIADQ